MEGFEFILKVTMPVDDPRDPEETILVSMETTKTFPSETFFSDGFAELVAEMEEDIGLTIDQSGDEGEHTLDILDSDLGHVHLVERVFDRALDYLYKNDK